MMSKPVRPRHAASLIIYRDGRGGTEVLMGRRHHRSRFKPGVYVFPGGAVESSDFRAVPCSPLDPAITGQLAVAGSYKRATAMAMAAVRETFEESGLLVAQAGDVGPNSNMTWQQIRGMSLAPTLGRLRYLGRAITPTSRPIRFHARFFCVNAKHTLGEVQGNGELEDLQWVPVSANHDLPLMIVTRTMMDALERTLAGLDERPLVLSHIRQKRVVKRG